MNKIQQYYFDQSDGLSNPESKLPTSLANTSVNYAFFYVLPNFERKIVYEPITGGHNSIKIVFFLHPTLCQVG